MRSWRSKRCLRSPWRVMSSSSRTIGRISISRHNRAMKAIAVIFGGKSAEHDVSIITAHIPIIDTLLTAGDFDVWPIYISKEGKWYCDKRMNDLRFFKESDWEQQIAKWKPVELLFEDGLQICWPRMFGKCVKI